MWGLPGLCQGTSHPCWPGVQPRAFKKTRQFAQVHTCWWMGWGPSPLPPPPPPLPLLTEADGGWASVGQIPWPRPGMNQAISHSWELVCGSLGMGECLVVFSSPSLPPPSRPHIRELFHGPHSQLIDITAGVLGWGTPKCFLIRAELLWVSTWLSPQLRRELLISERTGALWPELGDAEAAPFLFALWQALRPCVRFPRR